MMVKLVNVDECSGQIIATWHDQNPEKVAFWKGFIPIFQENPGWWSVTLQGTNISGLRKRKIIFKNALGKGYVSSQEGIPFGQNCGG